MLPYRLPRSCFFRPKPPYADWMTSAVEGKAGPVKPSADELALLEKVGSWAEGFDCCECEDQVLATEKQVKEGV